MNRPVQHFRPAEVIAARTLPPRKRRPATDSEGRASLFLQGPPGPLFRRLGERLSERGVSVYRINLSGGDLRDWPGIDSELPRSFLGMASVHR